MDDLFFHRITTQEYRARVAAHDGLGWHHAVYTVTTNKALQRTDPFNAWQATTPEGLVIAEGVPLIQAMRACNHDVPSYLRNAELDSSAVLMDPARIMEVL
jgi:hypothetical protein